MIQKIRFRLVYNRKKQLNKDGKADFAFNYRAHYDLSSPDDPPFEIYIKPGTAA